MILKDIFRIIIICAEGAYLQVGVFVGAVLLIFGYINYKKQGKLIDGIEKSKKIQPIIGALLGLSPGCGGAILVMPLYIKGTITFGTVIATLIATMGDSAFVMIAAMPLKYFGVSILCFIISIITGYIVDYFKIGKNLINRSVQKSKDQLMEEHKKYKDIPTEYECSLENYSVANNSKVHIGHVEGDEIDIILHHDHEINPSSFSYIFTHGIGYKIYWIIMTVGLILGIMLLFQIDINKRLLIPNIGTALGVFGTIFSILYMIISKKILKDDNHDEAESKLLSLKETLIHNAEETAFVNTWVFVAYFIYEIVVYAIGGEAIVQQWLSVTGMLSIFVGALIGLIPGCGPQIIFVTLFTKGFMPFAALLANAISQDGDALFPLIAMNKKSSLWATVITTIPAIIFGLIFYILFG